MEGVAVTRLQPLQLATLASLCIPLTALSQQEGQPVVTEGSRVRISSPLLEHRLVGTVVGIESNHVVIEPAEGDSEVRLPRDQVAGLELSFGKKSKWVTGGLVGGAAGGAIGLGVALSACLTEEGGCIGGAIPAFAAVSIGVGFGVGALIGNFIKADRWQEVSVETLRVEPMISQGTGLRGIALGLRLRI
jgi:hypothetical protein